MWGNVFSFLGLSLFLIAAHGQNSDFSQPIKKLIEIGDDYEKISYKKVLKLTTNSHIKNLIYNTVLINAPVNKSFNRGTGFYIGEHHGRHLFLTNAHILNQSQCYGAKIKFLDKNLSISTARCENVYFDYHHDEGSDLTLFSVRADEIQNIKGEGLSIDFNFSPKAALPLATNGFGLKKEPRFSSPSANTMAWQNYNPKLAIEKDCVIVSKDGVTKTFAGKNNLKVKHSFATGCDIVKGDSGSALINRNTGKVIGLIWAEGKEQPKGKNKISSAELWNNIIGSNDPRIWQHFSYAFSLKPFKKDFAPYLESL